MRVDVSHQRLLFWRSVDGVPQRPSMPSLAANPASSHHTADQTGEFDRGLVGEARHGDHPAREGADAGRRDLFGVPTTAGQAGICSRRSRVIRCR